MSEADLMRRTRVQTREFAAAQVVARAVEHGEAFADQVFELRRGQIVAHGDVDVVEPGGGEHPRLP